ncbi:ATP-binding protein [Romeriopsis navalis]|nr:ATP-binding protein [Romeriopsis navalis]
MTQQFKFGYRFLFIYAVPVLLSAVSAIAVHRTTERVTQQSKVTREEKHVMTSMSEMAYGLSRMARNVRGQVLFPQDASYRRSYNAGRAVFLAKADLLKTQVTEPQQRQRLLNMITVGGQHDRLAQKIFELNRQNKYDAAKAKLPQLRMGEIDRNYDAFRDQQIALLAEQSRTLKLSLFNLKLLVLISTLLSIGFATSLGFFVSRRFRLAQLIEDQSAALAQKNQQLQMTQTELIDGFEALEKAQSKLVQAEKMSSLGQLVAGVAHEINNPVNFIHGNLRHVAEYSQDLLDLVKAYQAAYPDPLPQLEAATESLEFDFVQADLPKMLASMKVGTDRIRHIVLSLRNFSRMDESAFKAVDIHEGIDSTLLILQHRLKASSERAAIELIREYSDLPLVECYAGQLNQVFMNILANAIDALEELAQQRATQGNQDQPIQITVRTALVDDGQSVQITIADNGIGIPPEVQARIFDPFFTTKPVGKGTGMGMSISYQLVTEKHHGRLTCVSTPGQGAKFVIELPLKQPVSNAIDSTITDDTAISNRG